MELLNKGKLLKESAFDVELSSPNGYSQHLLTVGMFARGLQSFAGMKNVFNFFKKTFKPIIQFLFSIISLI